MNSNSSTPTSFSSSNPVSADAISRRAYELWENEGRPEGNDLRHWLQAEQELSGASASASESQAQPVAARQAATDTRPLQGTRAGAAASKRSASASPFTSEKSGNGSATATAARRRV